MGQSEEVLQGLFYSCYSRAWQGVVESRRESVVGGLAHQKALEAEFYCCDESTFFYPPGILHAEEGCSMHPWRVVLAQCRSQLGSGPSVVPIRDSYSGVTGSSLMYYISRTIAL